MKQLFKSMAAFALAATLFTSCSKDGDSSSTTAGTEPGAPTLTIVAPTADLTLKFNAIATISFTAKPASGAKIKSVLITRKNLSTEVSNKVYGDSTASMLDSASINRTFSDSILNSVGNVNDKILYTVLVIDNKGKSASSTINVTIKDLYVTGQFTVGASANNTIQEKCIGFNENAPKTIELFKMGIATTTPSTADSATRARFNVAKVDMSFFFGASLSGLYSPTHDFGTGNGWDTEYSTWVNPNNTIFLDPVVTNISQSEFAAPNFNVEQIIDGLDFTKSPKTFANNLIDGAVVAFKTAKGAKGLILVVKSANSNTSFATFEAKWKK
jgi:hypothetical protein